jgi:hypothetical protein
MILSLSFQWFHWFDLLVIVAIGLGVYLNRHGNALHQIFGVIHWLAVLVVCAFLYKKPAMWLADATGMRPDIAALILYPLIVAAVYFLFGIKRRSLAKQADKVEMFGHREYHVAMAVGGLKAAIILFVGMAWINARYVTDADLHDYDVFCQDNFGGIHWPTLSTVQEDVFVDALSGRMARKYLSRVLVTPLPPPALPPEALMAKKGKGKEVNLSAKLGKGPDGADAIIDELENGRGKKHWGTKEGEGSAVETTNKTASAVKTERAAEIIYRQLSLKGISGTGAKRMALINNQTLLQGEEQLVKVEDHKVKVRCEEIREASVVIRVDDQAKLIELLLNAH